MIFQSLVIFYVKSIPVDLELVLVFEVSESETSKTAIFTHLEAVDLVFDGFQPKKIGQNLKN